MPASTPGERSSKNGLARSKCAVISGLFSADPPAVGLHSVVERTAMALLENNGDALKASSSRMAGEAVRQTRRGDGGRTGTRETGARPRHHVRPIALLSLLFLSAEANALAPAVSSVSLDCLVLESRTQEGALFGSCLHLEDSLFSAAEASAATILGARPSASVAALRRNTPFHFLQQVRASAHLRYEILLTVTAPPPVELAAVPVNVAVLGQFSRSETFNGSEVAPTASASALVYIRSNPTIPPVAADVLREQANTSSAALPNFDKIVSVSLMPGHVYIVDLVAGCQHNDAGSVPVTFSSSATCSALADPVFSLDQAALDAQLGSDSFPLVAFYRFEYSVGVTAIPEPGSAALMIVGLGGLAVLRRRRSLGAGFQEPLLDAGKARAALPLETAHDRMRESLTRRQPILALRTTGSQAASCAHRIAFARAPARRG